MELKQWKLAQCGEGAVDGQPPQEPGGWIEAEVPGAAQYDLMKAGKLENFYAGTRQAFAAEWVAKSDWLYKTEFNVPEKDLSAPVKLLRFNGVDTYSEIWLNGELIGETSNAYRVYEFPAENLKNQGNALLIRVKSHERMIRGKAEAAKRMGVGDKVEGLFGKSHIRRYQRGFFAGSSSLLNLGTGILGIGIYRPVEFIAYADAYIKDYHFRTLKIENDAAQCELQVEAGHIAGKRSLNVELKGADNEIVSKSVAVLDGDELNPQPSRFTFPLEIKNPKLWNPVGYGEPYLYALNIKILQDGGVVHEINKKVGIRTVELALKNEPGSHAPGEHAFYFKINGQKIFVHGQNHIPLDYVKVYREKAAYDRLFKLIRNQNVNLIRIWGGGAVENDSFYDRCDEMGILIWHDMFLHSNVYPDYDEAFVREFVEESAGILRRVRNHAALAIVCGGNEQYEGWDEWGWVQKMDRFYGEKLVREALPPVSAQLCPDLPYIYNSPHDGLTCQSPVIGECHNWGNFYNASKDPLFVTETCWTTESYSRPETLQKWMGLDMGGFEGMGWAQRWGEATSLPLLNRMPYTNWFRHESLRSYLHGLELEQMRADYSALSKFRFESPSNTGVIYWSFTKGGPLFQFGCVDYDGYPMMPYYAVKRVFSPIGVYVYRDVSDVCVMLSNHTPETAGVVIEAVHYGPGGKALNRWKCGASAGAGELRRVLRLEGLYETVRQRTKEVVYVSAAKDGKTIADDAFFFCPIAEYEDDYAPLGVDAEKIGKETWRLTLSASSPVRMAELECNHKAVFSDDYFFMAHESIKHVEVTVLERTSGKPAEVTLRALGSEEVYTIRLE